MRILNFGSINIDHVYSVPHFVRAGETLAADNYKIYAGGKGLNQSVALAKAGSKVCHAGKVDGNSSWLLDHLKVAGVDTTFITLGNMPTGHAIIQVSYDGQNSILLFGGSNQNITKNEIDSALTEFHAGDFLLLQNEISGTADLIVSAKARGMKIFFNPAPITKEVKQYPLELVDYLIVNEIEGAELTSCSNPTEIIAALSKMIPSSAIVLTLGSEGVIFSNKDEIIKIPANPVRAVDTTAAGDTFSGYFISELMNGGSHKQALEIATKAAAICVTRKGAADSIPFRHELA